jgi:RimJ/RimL family protein N-acetyltransferase
MTEPNVALAPVTDAWITELDTWRDDASQRSEFDDFGDRPPGGFARLHAENALDNVRLVLVDAGTQLAGIASWHPAPHGPGPDSLAWDIGVSVRPHWRGQGIGRQAHELLVEHLWTTTDVHRIEAHTDTANTAERAVLARIGFTHEGTLRRAQYRRGTHHDLAIYALLRPATSSPAPSTTAADAHDTNGPS